MRRGDEVKVVRGAISDKSLSLRLVLSQTGPDTINCLSEFVPTRGRSAGLSYLTFVHPGLKSSLGVK